MVRIFNPVLDIRSGFSNKNLSPKFPEFSTSQFSWPVLPQMLDEGIQALVDCIHLPCHLTFKARPTDGPF